MSEPLIRLPPLISHLSCVFIGLFLSYFLSSDTTKPECFLPGKLYIAIPDSFFAKGLSKNIREGHKVHFGKMQKSESFCLLKNTEASIVQNDSFIVTSFPLSNAKYLLELLDRKNKGKLILFQGTDMHSIPSCVETKIEYGYEH